MPTRDMSAAGAGGSTPVAAAPTRIAGLLAGAALFMVLGGLTVLQPDLKLADSDWTPFAVGGTLAATNPAHLYDPAAALAIQHRLVHGDFAGVGRNGLLPVIAPPWVNLMAVPFAGLGFGLGGRLWTLFELAALLAAGLLVTGKATADRALIALAGIPTLLLVLNGQVDGLVALGLAAGWWLHSRGRPYAAGFALGLTLAKPHLVLAVLAALLITRRWRVLAGWTGAALVLVLAATAVAPGSVPGWIEAALGSAGTIGDDLGLAGLVRHLGGGGPAAAMATLVALVLALLLARRLEPRRAAGVLILGGFLAAPHALGSDLVVLPLALLIAGRDDPRRLLALMLGVGVVVLLPVAGIDLGFDGRLLAVAAACLLTLLLMLDVAGRLGRPARVPAGAAATAGAADPNAPET